MTARQNIALGKGKGLLAKNKQLTRDPGHFRSILLM